LLVFKSPPLFSETDPQTEQLQWRKTWTDNAAVAVVMTVSFLASQLRGFAFGLDGSAQPPITAAGPQTPQSAPT